MPFDGDCRELKSYISGNFHDHQLIDYDWEHKLYNRENNKMSLEEIEAELAEDTQKVWKFLAENSILRDSVLLNKY